MGFNIFSLCPPSTHHPGSNILGTAKTIRIYGWPVIALLGKQALDTWTREGTDVQPLLVVSSQNLGGIIITSLSLVRILPRISRIAWGR
jgi:hypothetical protein